MNVRCVVISALAVALASVACQGPRSGAGHLTEKDLEAIRDVVAARLQAVLSNERESVASVHSDSAGNSHLGLEAPPPAIQVTSLEIDGHDDLAYAQGTYFLSIAARGAGEELERSGKFLAILRKQEDGSWKVTTSITRSEPPVSEHGSPTHR